MLDTSRRFYKMETLKQLFDSMFAAKFNVFHWHGVDDDSFPWNLTSYPNVTYHGAFEEDQVYTVPMMEEIVRYCQSLGIRVIPEFDNPGHARAIGNDPQFENLTLCFQIDGPSNVPDAYKVKGGPPSGVLDPSVDLTYELINGILTDINTTFSDNYIHLGGDEV
jgi:hexosaminidase